MQILFWIELAKTWFEPFIMFVYILPAQNIIYLNFKVSSIFKILQTFTVT